MRGKKGAQPLAQLLLPRKLVAPASGVVHIVSAKIHDVARRVADRGIDTEAVEQVFNRGPKTHLLRLQVTLLLAYALAEGACLNRRADREPQTLRRDSLFDEVIRGAGT